MQAGGFPTGVWLVVTMTNKTIHLTASRMVIANCLLLSIDDTCRDRLNRVGKADYHCTLQRVGMHFALISR